jgi:hypothetical protein
LSVKNDQRGFIFSLDATLAVLVVMVVMAGVARGGNSETIYEQYGYLRLQRYANDALEMLYVTGRLENNRVVVTVLDNIKALLAQGTDAAKILAENLAENALQSILPKDIQFRLRMGPENSPRLDNVYPSAGKHPQWRSAFDNAQEIAAAARVSVFTPDNKFDIIILYVWRGPTV